DYYCCSYSGTYTDSF
nr:immunoglobulin light chain junction region [Macaca mulatta]